MAMACAVICLSSVFAVSAFAAEAEIPDVEPTEQTAVILKEGLKDGLKEGTKEGLKNGLKEGTKSGLKNGMKSGMKNGLKNGLKNGKLKSN